MKKRAKKTAAKENTSYQPYPRRMDILHSRSAQSIRSEGLRFLHGQSHRLPKDPTIRLQSLQRIAAKHGLYVISNQGREAPLSLGDLSTRSWILDYYSSRGKVVTIEHSCESTTLNSDPIYAIRLASQILKRFRARTSSPQSQGKTRKGLSTKKEVYPRDLYDSHAKSLGIRIDEFSQNELRFYDQRHGDLLVIWNRSTKLARPTLHQFGETEIQNLPAAIKLADIRLRSERVVVGKYVELMNLSENELETFRITDNHTPFVADGTSLQARGPLGSQLMGLSVGMEFNARVPKGEIRYRIERIY